MKSSIQLYVVMLHTHVIFLDRISVYVLHTAWTKPSEAAFVLPQWIRVRISHADALILQELSNNRNIRTFLHTHTYVCECVRTMLVNEVLSYNDSMKHVKYILFNP